MAAEKPGTKPSLANELSDIPLSLEQDDNSLNAAQAQKAKTNSLKRFFRKTKSPVSEDAEPTPKEVRSLQLRFGTFHKNEDDQRNDMASGSGKEIASESRLNLPERLSSCWSNVFKRSSKRTPTSVRGEGTAATTDEN